MKTRSKFIKFVWPSLVFTALTGFGFWCQHRPDPNWYVSLPLNAQGQRVQGPIPYGWKMDPEASHLPVGLPKTDERVTIVFKSHEAVLSRCLRLLRRQPAPQPSHLYVDIGQNMESLGFTAKAMPDGKETTGRVLGVGPYLSYRIIKAVHSPLYVVVALTSDNKRTFDNNHASVNRFRIE